MKPRIIYGTRLVPPGYRAWVIFPYMLFKMSQDEVDDRLFRHEWEHVQQVYRDGWIKFYFKYIWYSIVHGYKNNPYEVMARAVQDEPLTAIMRYYKDKRYLLEDK